MATTAAPYGFWATNLTKKLAHWVYLLGQPSSQNRFFQNFSLLQTPQTGLVVKRVRPLMIVIIIRVCPSMIIPVCHGKNSV